MKTPLAPNAGPLERFRHRRRRAVKRFGKRLIRRMGDFLGSQSAVGNPAIFETSTFPAIAALDANAHIIRREVDAVLEHLDSMPRLQDISTDQSRISAGDEWKSFFFYGFGYPAPLNCALCPETTSLLQDVPGLENAWLSILLPGYRIPAHHGISRGLLTALHGVKTPEKRGMCGIRIEDEVRHFEDGKTIVFDDTLTHEIWNDTDEPRAVLIVDFRRPLRPLGWLFNRAFLAIFRQTGYVQDARQRFYRWEDIFYRHVQTGAASPQLGATMGADVPDLSGFRRRFAPRGRIGGR